MKYQPIVRINSYCMPIHIGGFTVSSEALPNKAFKQRVMRELSINLKKWGK